MVINLLNFNQLYISSKISVVLFILVSDISKIMYTIKKWAVIRKNSKFPIPHNI